MRHVPSPNFLSHMLLPNLWHFVSILTRIRRDQRTAPLGRRSVKTQRFAKEFHNRLSLLISMNFRRTRVRQSEPLLPVTVCCYSLLDLQVKQMHIL